MKISCDDTEQTCCSAKAWALKAWSARNHFSKKSDPLLAIKQDATSRMAQLQTPALRLCFMLEAGSQLASLSKISGAQSLSDLGKASSNFPILHIGPMVYFLAHEDGLDWMVPEGKNPFFAADLLKSTKLLAHHASDDCFFWTLHSLGPFAKARDREAKRMGQDLASTIASSQMEDMWGVWQSLASLSEESLNCFSPPSQGLMREIARFFSIDSIQPAREQARRGRMGLGLLIFENAPAHCQDELLGKESFLLAEDLSKFSQLAHWNPADTPEALRQKATSLLERMPNVFECLALRKDLNEIPDPMMEILSTRSTGSYERLLCLLARPNAMAQACETKNGEAMSLAWNELILKKGARELLLGSSAKDPCHEHASLALESALCLLCSREISLGLAPREATSNKSKAKHL